MTIRILGILFSILLHLSVLFLLPVQIEKDTGAKNTQGVSQDDDYYPLTVKLIPMEKPSQDPEILKGNKDAITYPTDGRICDGKDKTYRGIGIIYAYSSQTIIHAPEFYPGYKAGLRVGDYILNPNFEETNGYIDVMVMRGYNRLSFRIKPENICYVLE